MKCLDSDFLIAILKGDKSALSAVKKIDEEGKASTTSINSYEVLLGAKIIGKDVEEARKLLAKLNVLNFDEATADAASDIHWHLRKQGKMIGLRDIFIGSIAKIHGHIMVTRDKDFSNIKGLTVERW